VVQDVDGRAARKARSHERILDTAARLLREEGGAGLSVDAVMEGAGLTRGGFYAHFLDRDALVAAALERAFAQQRVALLGAARFANGHAALGRMLKWYLSRAHLESPGEGCPAPSLAGEVARAGAPLRRVFGANFMRLVELLRERVGASKSETLAVCAAAVGAMTLARAVADPALADAILDATRRLLLDSACPMRPRRRKTQKKGRGAPSGRMSLAGRTGRM
jgi:TetR/AcrR family transcriptional repressor of nem operon